jgi:hypothetical protein
MAENQFRYQERLTEGEVRIVTVLPGRRGTAISCILTVERLDGDTIPVYDALSYACGDPELCESVQIDGKKHGITRNLFEALQWLRPAEPDETLRIWIDAISIHQTDVTEKSVQVQNMDLVYVHANVTRVWLGPPTPGLEHALQTTVNLCKQPYDFQSFTQGYRCFKDVFKRPWYVHTLSTTNSRLLIPVDRFSRLWILQEVVLSKKCLAQCGNSTCDPEDLTNASKVINAHVSRDQLIQLDPHESSRISDNALQLASSLRGTREMMKQSHGLSRGPATLLLMLGAARRRGCTDPRDRYFGLLGILKRTNLGKEDLDLRADYAKSAASLFVEITARALCSPLGMCYLTAVHNERREQRESKEAVSSQLPSWVPDWSTQEAFATWGGYIYESWHTRRLPPRTMGGSLYAEGIVVSSIGAYAWQHTSTELDTESLEPLGVTALKAPTVYHVPEEALARTIVADSYAEPSGDVSGTGYKRWPAGDPLLRYEPWCSKAQVSATWHRLASGCPNKVAGAHKFPQGRWEYYRNWARTCLKDRNIYVSAGGHYVLAYSTTRPEDLITCLAGAPMPFILRQTGEGIRMMGPAYVHGIMDGEVLKAEAEGKFQRQTLEIR